MSYRNRKRKRQELPEGLIPLPFDFPRNITEYIRYYGNDTNYEARSEPTPVDFEPGSPEKVEELARRIEAGEALWHPDDRRVQHDTGFVEALLENFADMVGTVGVDFINDTQDD